MMLTRPGLDEAKAEAEAYAYEAEAKYNKTKCKAEAKLLTRQCAYFNISTIRFTRHHGSSTIIIAFKKYQFLMYFVTYPGYIWSHYKSTLTEKNTRRCRTGRYAQNTLQQKLK